MEEIPGYTVKTEYTRTNQAIIYTAETKATGEPAILKLVRNDPKGWREVEMLRLVANRNPDGPVHVMRLNDVHEDQDNLWLALEAFDDTLDKLVPSEMTPFALMSIALDSAKGLVEMHKAGVVDDDVKPANIAFKLSSGRVAHVDLGCARKAGEKPVGHTPEYVAPEIAAGRPSDTSPCYGWARTMEQVATGKFGFGPYDFLFDHVPWVGREFAALIARCCNRDHERRPSVTELYVATRTIVERRLRCRRCGAIMFDDGVCVRCKKGAI